MTVERVLTAVLIVGMLILYFFIMPGQVDLIEDARIVPRTIPSIAIWVIIGAALIQLIKTQDTIKVNWLLCLRMVLYGAMLVGGVTAMERFGFEYVIPPLALLVMLVIGERRPHWLVLGGVIIPVGVWLIVEHLLDRTLA